MMNDSSSQEPMAFRYHQLKDIKVRVYKWKESMINQEFSECGLFQCCIIYETMHVKQSNQDFLEVSKKCNIVNLEPIMHNLPRSYECISQTWARLCFSLLNGKGLIEPETVTWLSEFISAYLVSNYDVVRDTRDFKIVVVLNLYMKTIIDESLEVEPTFSFSEDRIGELLCRNYGLEPGKIIGPIHDFLFETEEKFIIFKEFFENDGNSLLNLYPASEDEGMIGDCIVKWLVEEPHRLRPNPVPDSWFEEVPPALTIKKYDAGCSKNPEESCAICLEELHEGDLVAVTPCSHIFHCTSILSWLIENRTCPMCRTVCPVHI